MAESVRDRLNTFFHPRLVHFRSDYETVPGRPPQAIWREPNHGLRSRVTRFVLRKKRQGPSSPLGFSKLPFELLDQIFHGLCGKEILAIRLVCSQWEFASRPFVAAQYLTRSVFWLTGPSLRMLEHLAAKFGPYIETIYITTDQFCITGLIRALKQYIRYRYSYVYVRRRRKIFSFLFSDEVITDIRTNYFGQWFDSQGGWHTTTLDGPSMRFFWYYLCSILSQKSLRILKGDAARLARIMSMLPNGDIEVAGLNYKPEQLSDNIVDYGKSAPALAFELALYCSDPNSAVDAKFVDELHRVVEQVKMMRPILT